MRSAQATEIVQAARDAGWTPTEIAAYVGCSVASIRVWARNDQKVNVALKKNLEKLARRIRKREGN